MSILSYFIVVVILRDTERDERRPFGATKWKISLAQEGIFKQVCKKTLNKLAY